jgi:NTP pyrophosphatase (non-canonical NTP hydrolase)
MIPAMQNDSPFTISQDRPTLGDLQGFTRRLIAAKQWTTDPEEIFILLTEEVGEVAKEVRRSWKRGRAEVKDALGAELADVLMYVFDLANAFDIDLEQALRAKMAHNATRVAFGA